MWTVWVGGSEVNDYYLPTLEKAESLAELWRDSGYDEIEIEEVTP
jgi:hypothetical protein